MTPPVDKLGRKRSPATLPGFRKGQPNGNKGKRFRAETLTPEEILLLISGQNKRAASGLRHRALIALLWRSGLRIQEALDLQIGDLNYGAAAFTVHVRRGKGDKARFVAVDPFAWEFMAPWLARRANLEGIHPDHGYVFCVTDGPTKGNPMGSAHVRTMLKRTAEMSGIKRRVNPHALRHTFACECFEEGQDLRVIQNNLGHGSLAITSHYLNHLSPKAQLEAAAARPSPVGKQISYQGGLPEGAGLTDAIDAVRAAADGEEQ